MPISTVGLLADREGMNDATQTLCFVAGANSIFTGDKLLTAANAALMAKLGLRAMEAEEPMRACKALEAVE